MLIENRIDGLFGQDGGQDSSSTTSGIINSESDEVDLWSKNTWGKGASLRFLLAERWLTHRRRTNLLSLRANIDFNVSAQAMKFFASNKRCSSLTRPGLQDR